MRIFNGGVKLIGIEFFWNDLTEKKKKEILDLLGENCIWDVFPFCIPYGSTSDELLKDISYF